MGRKAIDMSGMTINMLTVIEKSSTGLNGAIKWKCTCECGNTIIREGAQLRSGYAFSCGCITRRMRNAIGQKFGRLIVMKTIGKTQHKGQIVLCTCDCGNQHKVALSALVQNLVRSCGCLNSETTTKQNKDRALAHGVAAFNSLYGNYQARAVKKGLRWELSKDEFAILTQQNCYYCNIEPKQIITIGTTPYTYNGVDRIDSTIGYTAINCVSCCKRCNTAKNNMTTQEFKTMIQKIYEYWVIK